MRLPPDDARLVAEYNQLSGKAGIPDQERLDFLEKHLDLVEERDDCSVQMVTLLNAVGRSGDALNLLHAHRFHPWEGGEEKVLRQYTEAHLRLGRKALEEKRYGEAFGHARQAMDTPENLGRPTTFSRPRPMSPGSAARLFAVWAGKMRRVRPLERRFRKPVTLSPWL